VAGVVFQNPAGAIKKFSENSEDSPVPPVSFSEDHLRSLQDQNKLNNFSGRRIVKNRIRQIALVGFGAVLAIGLCAGLGDTAQAGGFNRGSHGSYGHNYWGGYGNRSYGYNSSYGYESYGYSYPSYNYSYSYPSYGYSYNYSPSYYGSYSSHSNGFHGHDRRR